VRPAPSRPAVVLDARAAPPPVRKPRPEPVEVEEKKPRRRIHLLPVLLLLVGLLVVVVRDALLPGVVPDTGISNATEIVDPRPYLALRFLDKRMEVTLSRHGSVKPTGNRDDEKTETGYWYPSMRFGLRTVNRGGENKNLTYMPNGERPNGQTNNTCLRIDGDEFLYGDKPFHTLSGRDVGPRNPGHWQDMELPLGKDSDGRERIGKKSVWVYDDPKISITQIVEIVPGLQVAEDAHGNLVRHLDTCLVRYEIANNDTDTHTVGLRFLLDTFIGSNDGVPFLIPVVGPKPQLCDTEREFNTPDSVPDYIQALEHDNLDHPGTIARLQLKLGGKIEAPSRVTLGAWPNPELGRRHPELADRCQQEKTMWDVPVLPIKSLPDNPDSAVTMYWDEKPLRPSEVRTVGFAYGLGSVSTSAGGQLGLSARGSVQEGDEFTLSALVPNPRSGQTVTLELPEGFKLIEGNPTQAVPPLSDAVASHTSAVTWRIQAPNRDGTFTLGVTSSTGLSQSQKIRVTKLSVF